RSRVGRPRSFRGRQRNRGPDYQLVPEIRFEPRKHAGALFVFPVLPHEQKEPQWHLRSSCTTQFRPRRNAGGVRSMETRWPRHRTKRKSLPRRASLIGGGVKARTKGRVPCRSSPPNRKTGDPAFPLRSTVSTTPRG